MFKDKEEFKTEYAQRIVQSFGRPVEQADITEQFITLEQMVRDYASENWALTKLQAKSEEKKQLYYFSAEFLMGRMLVNNMMNLGIYEIVKEGLADYEINIHELEELESDPGLGNGGLGRLAACFLDSLASMSLVGHGHTLRYEYGLFKQKIKDGYQVEVPDIWLRLGNTWEVRKYKHAVDVKFWGRTYLDTETNTWKHVDYECVKAVPYDMPIIGKDTHVTNTLRLWHAEPSENIPNNKNFQVYNQEVQEICQNLYPDDSKPAGKTLRLKQQYFFTAAGLDSIVREHKRNYGSLDTLQDKVVIQLNDTHPVLAIPELMRILIDDNGYQWDKAWNIVTHTFAYTNHTILAEALEKWEINMFKALLPRIYQIIDEINHRFEADLKARGYQEEFIREVRILHHGQVHMARLAIIASQSVNGVARLHTDILMHREMTQFNELYPNKFNNKTNGVTHRRWLLYANPELSKIITDTIGDSWIHHPEDLEKLMAYTDDPVLQGQFLNVKRQKKIALAKYIKEHNGIDVDVDSIFDIQVKRLHAYKRQLLNVLHIIYIYQEMKRNPDFRIYPHTFIFGAKAASSYYFAKKVIKLINSVADVVNNDPDTSRYLKVVFLENYGVTLAEMIMPAADVSEQISTAGKEASGTGNMKFMMNGAITLGTEDGANVEIHERVGDENCEIFGLLDSQIDELKLNRSYRAWDYYNNDYRLRTVIDSLVNGTWSSVRDEFNMVYDELMNKNDEYFLLADFDSYMIAHQNVEKYYQDKQRWAKICLVNIAKSGYFSSDRTIDEYAKEIWHLSPLESLK